MRGEAEGLEIDAKLSALPAPADDALAQLKEKMAADKAARQKALAAAQEKDKEDKK
jgi:hypothetical protein